MTGINIGSPQSPRPDSNGTSLSTPGRSLPDEKQNAWASWLVVGLAIAAVVMVAFTTVTGGVGSLINTDNAASTTNQAESSMSGMDHSQHVEATGEEVTKDITIEGMSYSPSSIDVPKGATLTVNVTNNGMMQHDLTLNGKTTPMLSPGESATLVIGVIGDSMEGWCTVAGHRETGMVLQVNAVDNGSSSSSAKTQQSSHKTRDATLPAASDEKIHNITLTMTEEEREVAPGKTQMQWLFNGQAPGPVLRGTVGDTFRITLKNEGSMGHSIDFHAGEVSPDAVMKTIQPGESLVYEFTADRAGSWMYHCSTAPMSLHIANGMAGMVVIDPADDSDLALDHVDHEYAFAASEVFLADKGDEHNGANATKVNDNDFDMAAFNGYPNQYVDNPIRVKVGDRVRFWVTNLGPNQDVSFHIVGTVFDTVFTEGHYTVRNGSEEQTGAQVLPLMPAQGGFVEVEFKEAGTYTMVNHATQLMEKGQKGKIVVEE